MRAGFGKRGLVLSLGIFALALVALGIVFLGPSFAGLSSAEVTPRASSGPAGTSSEAPTAATAPDCSDAPASDFACLQRRYENLVRDSGVEAAFAAFRDELPGNELASSKCHELTHIIGFNAADLYGDIGTTYGRARASAGRATTTGPCRPSC